MNTFELAKRAIDAVREHVCDTYNAVKTCPRNGAGVCLIKVRLWDAQNRAALAWNAPVVIDPRDRPYL
ncbi:MAG: hypothetical protein ACREHG_08010 [Candidatus Saccharimonadales bacterium]